MKTSRFFVERNASLGNDVMASFVTALSIIPQVLVFAFLAGVSPTTALFSALVISIITALLGGRPVMISTPISVLSVVMIRVIGEYGEIYLIAAGIAVGLIQLIIAGFKLGKFIRLLPRTVMLGFINGMVITLLIQQNKFLLTSIDGEITWFNNDQLIITLGLALFAWAIVYYFPLITKKLPSAIIAFIVITSITLITDLPVYTISDFTAWVDFDGNASITPNFDGWIFSSELFNWTTFLELLPFILLLTLYSTSQSLVSLVFVDELTNTKGNSNKEIMALGTANIVSGLWGGVMGSANIEQSIINFKSGGRSRSSSIFTACFLFAFLFFIPQYVGLLPIPAFMGLILAVVGGTFTWSSFKILNKIQKTEAFVMIMVTIVTIFSNPVIAVLSGVILSALMFSWENALRIRVRTKFDEQGIKHYEIYGPLFFGSTSLFLSKFDPENDAEAIIINFYESRIWDHSGIEALKSLVQNYVEAGKDIKIKHLSRDSRFLLQKSGMGEVELIVDENDPEYNVVIDTPIKFY